MLRVSTSVALDSK